MSAGHIRPLLTARGGDGTIPRRRTALETIAATRRTPDERASAHGRRALARLEITPGDHRCSRDRTFGVGHDDTALPASTRLSDARPDCKTASPQASRTTARHGSVTAHSPTSRRCRSRLQRLGGFSSRHAAVAPGSTSRPGFPVMDPTSESGDVPPRNARDLPTTERLDPTLRAHPVTKRSNIPSPRGDRDHPDCSREESVTDVLSRHRRQASC